MTWAHVLPLVLCQEGLCYGNKWPRYVSGWQWMVISSIYRVSLLSWLQLCSTSWHHPALAAGAGSVWTLSFSWQSKIVHHMLALKVSAQKWHTLFLLTFHWPKQFTWLCLSSTDGTYNFLSQRDTSRRNTEYEWT